MNKIKLRTIFAAVSNKSILDPLLEVLDIKSVKFWGTQGTINYVKVKGYSGKSVVAGFDFDGRVKSLDRVIFARILTDRTNKKHLEELKKLVNYSSNGSEKSNVIASTFDELSVNSAKQSSQKIASPSVRDDKRGDWNPVDAVIVDLYPLDEKNFPESMDIGGQALIRAAVKNYKSVTVAFDKSSLASLADELIGNDESTTLNFRKTQAKKAAEFIAERCKDESNYFRLLSSQKG